MSETSKPVMVQVEESVYLQLLADQRMLEALQGAGVDNWEGYDSAMEMLEDEDARR